ncbi:MAG TPA: D-Ala-D-Ala carboxypeptidase family metallohydrolase [Azospirillaceae bacterium]|nr:D-Ala-D-Ala carboxypeptidase family metallohydrolase [Azospirillaceae bacterium]
MATEPTGAAEIPRDLTDLDFSAWPNFSRAELACRGSGECRMDPGFMGRLQNLRVAFGKPLRVTSGYRSPAHNAAVSGTGEAGPHTTGRAVDIAIGGPDVWRLVQLAQDWGFTGIGLRQAGPMEGRYVHLDDLPPSGAHPRPRVWTY